MASTLTYIRSQADPVTAVRLDLPISTPEDEEDDVIISQLSSPLQSYEITSEPGRVVFKHPKSYRVRFQSAKSTIEELRSGIKTLKDMEAQRKARERQREDNERRREDNERQREQILIDWEIRSRIAQALNDVHVRDVPEDVLSRLKDERFGYLPASLSNWASYHKIPIPALGHISDDDFNLYSLKGANIRNKGLADDMSTAWDSIPPDSRLLIINMWVSRPESRRDISHPTPTIDQAERLVDADSNLTPREVALAKAIICTAVDQNHVPLFRNTESSMD